ncbi:MAG: succinyl-diaminopimelate desuccinylase [Candidatus Nanopelagicales bacterium]
MLQLTKNLAELTADLVDIPSVSLDEKNLADQVQSALEELSRLEVTRIENTLIARTNFGFDNRIVLAGHLDTVPANNNQKSQTTNEAIHGLGAVDMKGGLAVMLKLLQRVSEFKKDVTFLFYEAEEIESKYNGLEKISKTQAKLLEADFAILLEPTGAVLEMGCQGSVRFKLTIKGTRAHSARWWKGDNAIHKAQGVLEIVNSYQPRSPVIDGLTFREGLQIVGISGGVAGNVIPDSVEILLNHRFAPDRDQATAIAHLRELFADFELEIIDVAEAAPVGLNQKAIADFVKEIDLPIAPKFGWTDVARFSKLNIPAINFGPGDPHLAHHPDEMVPIADLELVYQRLISWLMK